MDVFELNAVLAAASEHSPSRLANDKLPIIRKSSEDLCLTKSRERIWATAISVSIASLSVLLGGFTLGFPSASVLQLQELPGGRRFDTLQIDILVVRKLATVVVFLRGHYLVL